MADLLVIVPTRGRPGNIRAVIAAWRETGAFADAELLVAFDADDPERDGYAELTATAGPGIQACEFAQWQPMVRKLDAVALEVAGEYRALGFAGDDHLPRTAGWARAYLETLAELGTGIAYGNDLLQGERLPTQWAMTSDIVRTLGRMVPAPVEHLYSDNAILQLGRAAGCIRYLPEVIVEHVHPSARKAPNDDGYQRVNSREQYRHDGQIYQRWLRDWLPEHAAAVRALREPVPA